MENQKTQGVKLRGRGEKPSLRLARFIIKKQKWIESVFAAGCLFSLIAMLFVNVNYDLTEYLPDTARSHIGLDQMESAFGYPGTARVMLKDVSLYEAKQYKDRLEAVDGVDQILWCDSTVNIYAGEDFIDMESIEDYYKDGRAVMDVTFDEGDTSAKTAQAIEQMQAITGEKGYYVGMAVQTKSLTENVESEMSLILTVAVIMIFAVLCITTNAWSEPFLFLLVMGVAILLNRGTNIFIGTVSFLTDNVAMVLQLATSMDYSIFLLDAFSREREGGLSEEEAMVRAVDDAINSIFAISLTTVVGFLALVSMKFTIGFDMGLVLAKGIVFSLLTVVFFMPAMILKFASMNERTRHRRFLPDFQGLSRRIYKARYASLALMLLLVPPAYVAQGMNTYLYGNSAVGASEGTKVYADDQVIVNTFGRSNMLLALYPNTSSVREREMPEAIEALPYVKSVTSLAVMGLLGRGGSASGSARFLEKELLGLPEKELDQIRGNSLTMIFQDPLSALNPVFPIGRQIMESMEAHTSLSRREREERAAELLKKVGLGDISSIMEKYPHQLSGGQRQRVMIAMALACGPKLLIADEPTTALDVTIQAQIMELLLKLREETGMAILLITHDMGVVAQMADRVLVMYAGQIIEQAPVFDLFDRPAHPYTRALMAAMPTVGRGREHVLSSIRGTVPERYDQMTGCRFGPRCPYRTERCGEPQIDREFDTAGRGPEEQNRLVRCCRAEEITADAG